MAYKGRRALPAHNDGDMHDAFSGWRRLLCVFNKPGVLKKTRRRFHKLARRVSKQGLRRESE